MRDKLVNHEVKQHVREMYVDENKFDIDTDHRMFVLRYKRGEKWRLKAANWKKFDKELRRRVWTRNGNVNDLNKEMAKTLYATAEEIIGKGKYRRFTGKDKWFTKEIKEERMRRKILNKK
ncbi:hypothetical protein FHG87_011445 [Trinorchestia longiramus]|nr:hypothetical protein FHG87_011445 [Trinorchestia longiramus]